MRKTIFTLGLMLAAALSLTNCTKNEEATFTPEVKVPFELYANMDDTRTTNNNGLSTEWAANDKINVFHAVANTEGYVNDGKFTTENGDGKFKGSLANTLTADAYDWYACYPYKSYMTSPNNTSEGWLYVGSRSDKAQTQTGNNSMAHIAGEDYPLYGVAEGVAASAKPSITMSHASSLVEFNVTNTLDEAITVNSIVFTVNGDDEKIVGQFFMAIHEGTPSFTNGEFTSNVATLNVANGEAIAAGASAKFYMGIKPFDADEYAMTVAINATSASGTGTCTKEQPLVTTTFAPGKIKTLNVGFDAVMAEETAKELPFSETFGTSKGDFTIEDVELGSLSNVWSFASGYGMKATAYVNYTNNAAESWLVSPLIAIPAETEGAPILTFDHVINFAKGTTALTLKVLADDVWTSVEIPNYTTVDSWTFVPSGDIDLSAYKGKDIKFAFVYTSTAETAATVEIKNVLIDTRKFSQTLSFPEASYTVKVGDSFTAPDLSGAKTVVTYSSSNEAVATVNATTGAITLGNTPGNTVITATAAEDATYNSASASYTIVLEDASIVTATGTISFRSTTQRTSFSDEAQEQIWNNDGITLKYSKGSATTNLVDNSNPARFFKNTDIEITSSDGKMTQIDFVCSSSSYATSLKNSIGSAATVSGSNVTVVLDGTSDTFTVRLTDGQVRVFELTVTYLPADPNAPSMSVDETSVEVTAEATIEQVNVSLKNLKDGDVAVTSSDSWVSASLSAGVLSLNIAENTDLAGREATITLSATDVEDVTITVSQQGAVTDDPVETIVMSSYGFTNGQEVSSVTGTNFTVTFNQGEASNTPKYYTTGTGVRVYGGGNFVISSTTKKFYKVVVTYDSDDKGNEVTADSGTYIDGTWTGTDTNSVTFSVGSSSGHRRIQRIEITYKN